MYLPTKINDMSYVYGLISESQVILFLRASDFVLCTGDLYLCLLLQQK